LSKLGGSGNGAPKAAARLPLSERLSPNTKSAEKLAWAADPPSTAPEQQGSSAKAARGEKLGGLWTCPPIRRADKILPSSCPGGNISQGADRCRRRIHGVVIDGSFNQTVDFLDVPLYIQPHG